MYCHKHVEQTSRTIFHREIQIVSSRNPVGLILGFAVQRGAVALVNEVLLGEVALVVVGAFVIIH